MMEREWVVRDPHRACEARRERCDVRRTPGRRATRCVRLGWMDSSTSHFSTCGHSAWRPQMRPRPRCTSMSMSMNTNTGKPPSCAICRAGEFPPVACSSNPGPCLKIETHGSPPPRLPPSAAPLSPPFPFPFLFLLFLFHFQRPSPPLRPWSPPPAAPNSPRHPHTHTTAPFAFHLRREAAAAL